MADSGIGLATTQQINQTSAAFGQMQQDSANRAAEQVSQVPGQYLSAKMAVERQRMEQQKLVMDQQLAAEQIASSQRQRDEIAQRMAATQQLQAMGLQQQQVRAAKAAADMAEQQVETAKLSLEESRRSARGDFTFSDIQRWLGQGDEGPRRIGDKKLTVKNGRFAFDDWTSEDDTQLERADRRETLRRYEASFGGVDPSTRKAYLDGTGGLPERPFPPNIMDLYGSGSGGGGLDAAFGANGEQKPPIDPEIATLKRELLEALKGLK